MGPAPYSLAGPTSAPAPHASPYRPSTPSSATAIDDDVPEATWIPPSPVAAAANASAIVTQSTTSPTHLPPSAAPRRPSPALRRTVPASLSPSLVPAWVSLPPSGRWLAHWLLQAAWQGALSVPHQSSPEAPRLFRLLLRVFARAGLSAADWKRYVAATPAPATEAAARVAAAMGLFPSPAAAAAALAVTPSARDIDLFIAFAASIFANMGNYSAHDDSKLLPPVSRAVFISLCLRAPASPPPREALLRERWRRRLVGAAGAERDLVRDAQEAAVKEAALQGAVEAGPTGAAVGAAGGAESHWARVSLMLKACIDQVYNDAPEVMHLGSTGMLPSCLSFLFFKSVSALILSNTHYL